MTAEQCQLLRFLAQLNDDVWAQLLLPKLVADGSAASVALTCSTVRQLCQYSTQQLKLLFGGITDTAAVRRCMEPLPERFPACSRIELSICEESSIIFPTILDALARQVHAAIPLTASANQQPWQAYACAWQRLPRRLWFTPSRMACTSTERVVHHTRKSFLALLFALFAQAPPVVGSTADLVSCCNSACC